MLSPCAGIGFARNLAPLQKAPASAQNLLSKLNNSKIIRCKDVQEQDAVSRRPICSNASIDERLSAWRDALCWSSHRRASGADRASCDALPSRTNGSRSAGRGARLLGRSRRVAGHSSVSHLGRNRRCQRVPRGTGALLTEAELPLVRPRVVVERVCGSVSARRDGSRSGDYPMGRRRRGGKVRRREGAVRGARARKIWRPMYDLAARHRRRALRLDRAVQLLVRSGDARPTLRGARAARSTNSIRRRS